MLLGTAAQPPPAVPDSTALFGAARHLQAHADDDMRGGHPARRRCAPFATGKNVKTLSMLEG